MDPHPGGRRHGLDRLSIQRSRSIQTHNICVSSTKRDVHARSVDEKSGAHGATFHAPWDTTLPRTNGARTCRTRARLPRSSRGAQLLALRRARNRIRPETLPCRTIVQIPIDERSRPLHLARVRSRRLHTNCNLQEGSRKFPRTYNRPRKVECDFHDDTFNLCCVPTMRGWEENRRSILCEWPND